MRELVNHNNPNVLMSASVASMIDLFNMDNIRILKDFACKVDVAANFQEGNITSQKRVDEFKNELIGQNINVVDVPIPLNIFHLFINCQLLKNMAYALILQSSSS